MEKKPGLSKNEVTARLKLYGKNIIQTEKVSALRILLNQFLNPLIYLLIIAAAISFALSSRVDALIIASILFINALLSFIQEYRSEKSVEALHNLIRKTAIVRRDNKIITIYCEEIVPGDIVLVKEGDVVPADGIATISENSFIDEAVITGESLGVIKGVNDRFLGGTTIMKGYAELLIDKTGKNTELGKIASIISKTRKISGYEKEIKQMTNFLMPITFIILLVFFAANLFLKGINSANLISLLLFTIALAISIVPEALPVIATLTMSTGALKLAKKRVVVKRLSAIEDLGNINVLCTDKTGTITENSLAVRDVVTDKEEEFYTYIYLSTEDSNPFDQAISEKIPESIKKEAKKYEILDKFPFDPGKKRRWTLIKQDNRRILIVLGLVDEVAKLSGFNTKSKDYIDAQKIQKAGLRVLGLGIKEVNEKFSFKKEFDDKELTFLGYYSVYDPIRSSAAQTIEVARRLNVQVKILTGDSIEVANFIGRKIGLLKNNAFSYSQNELEKMSAANFQKACKDGVIFGNLTPELKCKIIETLKKDNVVGYQGDGINDAPALKVANVGIAVQSATDVAREAADIILLEKSLGVIITGIEEGRKIFRNIDKYIKHTMASNWGIFFALAFASFFTNLLPLLPIQVLLTNLLSDLPLLAISTDNVDQSEVRMPIKYDVQGLIKLPIILGILTSIVNLVFYLIILNNPIDVIRTLWFVFITITSLVVIFSVRKNSFMWKGKLPSKILVGSCLVVVLITFLLPFFGQIPAFHFTKISFYLIGTIIAITLVYLFILDFVKVGYFKLFANYELEKTGRRV